MVRIQILELPSKVVGELVEVPFAVIVDQVEDGSLTFGYTEKGGAFGRDIGASAVACFTEKIEIPANNEEGN